MQRSESKKRKKKYTAQTLVKPFIFSNWSRFWFDL